MPGGIAFIHDLFNNPRLRAVLLKLRLPLGLVAGLLLALQFKPDWFGWGVGVSAFGALFQLWCFGCIKTQKVLAVNGPYMFMRNPMYIARFFLILGFLLFAANPWIVAVYVLLYYLYMVNRVRREEPKLRAVFGADYEQYCAAVPRFVPGFKPYGPGSFVFFRMEYFLRNHGGWNLLAVLAGYAVSACFAFRLWR